MTWLCIPSARPVAEVNARMQKWRRMGYRIALWRDWAPESANPYADFPEVNPAYPDCDVLKIGTYPGYAVASNALIKHVFSHDPSCDWVVCGGDDVDPDLNKTADEIAAECSTYFLELNGERERARMRAEGVTVRYSFDNFKRWSTFGCLQPVGDRWGENEPGARQRWPDAPAMIDRICGSPWIGREFARRVNGGRGPWCEDYGHMFVDQHLLEVAKRLGVLWQRRDLIHYHDHWGRKVNGAHIEDIPEHLKFVSGSVHWAEAEAIFKRHQANGFAESLELVP